MSLQASIAVDLLPSAMVFSLILMCLVALIFATWSDYLQDFS